MIYRKIGSTGLKSSILGFGCWQLGGALSIAGQPHSFGKIDENEARKSISFSLEQGINFFDTADLYGLGKSESILGDELKGLGVREEAIISTKVGYIADESKGCITDCSYEHIMASCNSSLRRLKTDYIDIYLLHFVPPPDRIKESLDAFKELKSSGRIREYGISVGHKLEKIPELVKDFPVIEGYYNLLLRRFEEYEALFRENEEERSFIAASPLSRGLLSGKEYNPDKLDESDVRRKWKEGGEQHSWYKEQKKRIAGLKMLGEEWGIPLKNLAIACILSNENVCTAIPGMKSRQNVSELLKSLDYIPLDKEKSRRIRELSNKVS